VRPDGTINESYRPIALSIYHQFMPIWLETFSRNQLLIVSGDTLITRPATELAKIESFLNIEPRLGPRNFYFNKTKGTFMNLQLILEIILVRKLILNRKIENKSRKS